MKHFLDGLDPDVFELDTETVGSGAELVEAVVHRVTAGSGVVRGLEGESVDVAGLFDALAGYLGPALQRHFADLFDVVATPGAPVSQALEPGDIILTRLLGEGGVAQAAAIMGVDVAREEGNTAIIDAIAPFPRGEEKRTRGTSRSVALERKKIVLDLRLLPHDHLIVRVRSDRGAHPGEDVVVGEAEASSTGNDFVRFVQRSLNQILGTNLVVDGIAGGQTRKAIKEFQARNNLVVDGVVGPKTEGALRAAVAQAPNGGGGGVGGGGVDPAQSGPCPPVPPLPARCQGLGAKETLSCFDFGSDKVLPRHQPQIVNIARCILESRKTKTPITTLGMIGHTDPVGSDADNDKLGLKRAEAVKAELITTLERMTGGRPPAVTITTDTRGEHEPVAGDAALSRRVEVIPPFVFTPERPEKPKPKETKPGPDIVDEGNIVRVLIRATAYFSELEQSIKKVPDNGYVLLAGWLFDPNLKLPSGTLVVDLLKRRARDGVDIRVLGWVISANVTGSGLVSFLRKQGMAKELDGLLGLNDQTIRFVRELRKEPAIGNRACLNVLAHPAGAAHMKFVMVGDDATATVYTGGLDLDEFRTRPFWYDLQLQIQGPVVTDCHRVFADLWNELVARPAETVHGLKETAPSHDASTPPLANRIYPLTGVGPRPARSLRTLPAFNLRGGSVGVPNARPLSFAPGGSTEIAHELEALLKSAQRYAYLEDQYLSSEDIMDWLNDALTRNKDLRVVLVTGVPDPNDPPVASVRAQAINNHLLKGITNPNQRVVFVQHRTDIVHAKTAIVDDHAAIIGSANWARRGLFTDIEQSVRFEDSLHTLQPDRQAIWGHHLGSSPTAIAAAVAKWFAIPFGAVHPKFERVKLPIIAPKIGAIERFKFDTFFDADSRQPWPVALPSIPLPSIPSLPLVPRRAGALHGESNFEGMVEVFEKPAAAAITVNDVQGAYDDIESTRRESAESYVPEDWHLTPKVKTWLESVSADPGKNEGLLLFVRFHPQPRMAIVLFLHAIKAKQAWAKDVIDEIAAASDINALLDEIAEWLRVENFSHSRKDPDFDARFEAEKQLRDDVAEAIERIADWRRVRAYQIKAVGLASKWRVGGIGKTFANRILRESFPRLYGRIQRSAVPWTIYESIGWQFRVVGEKRLAEELRFQHLAGRKTAVPLSK